MEKNFVRINGAFYAAEDAIAKVYEKAIKAKDNHARYIKYIEKHPMAVSNGTAKTYRSRWATATEDFVDCFHQYMDQVVDPDFANFNALHNVSSVNEFIDLYLAVEEKRVKELAEKNYERIYGDTDNFEEVWPSLETLEEKKLFAWNCCVAYKRGSNTTEHEIYWHCYNCIDNCWHDYDHEVFQNMLKNPKDRANIEIWNSINGGTISLI